MVILLFLVILIFLNVLLLFFLTLLLLFVVIVVIAVIGYCHGNRTFMKVWFDLNVIVVIDVIFMMNIIITLLGLDYLLTPDKIHAKARSTVFKDVWAGSYNTIVRSTAVCFLFIFIHFFFQLVRWNFVLLVINVVNLSSLF